MRGRMCPECENINWIRHFKTYISPKGRKIRIDVCFYCDVKLKREREK